MRYKHNIELYEGLRNQGLTWREIAQQVNIKDHTTITRWVDRNYKEVITFKPKVN